MCSFIKAAALEQLFVTSSLSTLPPIHPPSLSLSLSHMCISVCAALINDAAAESIVAYASPGGTETQNK